MHNDYQTLEFLNAADWRQWLTTHHGDTAGVWLKIYKKHSGRPSITIEEALDQALCFGWIDGQRKSNDEWSYLQKYTPRRKTSMWSKRNIEHVSRLIEAGHMTSAGQAEIDRAKADGRWDAAYDAQRDMEIPKDFFTELDKYPKAGEAFEALNKSSRFLIGYRLQTAKTEETRQRRMNKILATLDAGEKLI
jgi:uncharacterized protein YdeI (YjbR/CyaY-like superfamily)